MISVDVSALVVVVVSAGNRLATCRRWQAASLL